MDYELEAVFSGVIGEKLVKKASHASFDERLSVIGLLISRCQEQFRQTFFQEQVTMKLFELLKEIKEGFLGTHSSQPVVFFKEIQKEFLDEWQQKKDAEILSRGEEKIYRRVGARLDQYELALMKESGDGEVSFSLLKDLFMEDRGALEQHQERSGQMLEYAFDFMEAVFAAGQEMVIFITELNRNYYTVRFLQEYDCERYYMYNKNLLFEENRRGINARLSSLQV
jgi:hypothetical protein